MADNRLLEEFVGEAREHLAAIGHDLLALEQAQAADPDRLARLFRAVNSIKGGAGYLGLHVLESLTHAIEEILEEARVRNRPLGAVVCETLLAAMDRVSALIDDAPQSNQADVGPLLARLRAGLGRETAEPSGQSLVPFLLTEPELAQRPAEHRCLYGVTADLTACREAGLSPPTVIERLQSIGLILNARLDLPEVGLDVDLSTLAVRYLALVSSTLLPNEFGARLQLPATTFVVLNAPEPEPAVVVEPPLSLPSIAATSPVPMPPEPIDKSATVRIPVQLIDRLMTLAGELVLIRNQAIRAIDPSDTVLRPIAQRLDGITTELQEAAMQTRMQPVGNLFNRFPRLVRDLAKQLGKQIELDIIGTEVELDKTILEQLSDPLTHLIRNACDHGIELPAERIRQGKSPVGRVSLSARHLSGQIYIEVRDDGKGIDPQAIKRKAIAQALRSPGEIGRLSDRELFSLILLPGFSTKTEVTDISGRGVGMDVVKTNLDRLGGVLEIDSKLGSGTTFELRLPLTLAIIPCLIVVVHGERFAIPQKDLEELGCIHPHELHHRIEHTFDQEVVRLRDRLLPLVRLAEVLARPEPFTPRVRSEILHKYSHHRDKTVEKPLFFAVVKVGSQRFGLVIDDILNTEEIVIKPMHSALKNMQCFAGATIMGDGRVALILSIEGTARHAGVSFETGSESVPAPREFEKLSESQTVLLFEAGPLEQYAIPLGMIRRLEWIRLEEVEKVGDKEFITLAGVPTAIVRMQQILSVSPTIEKPTMYLLIPKNIRRPLGFLLSRIIDIETLTIDVHTDAFRAEGLIGSAIVRGRMTLLLDVYRLADLLEPAEAKRPLMLPERRKRVLMVEDTQFFRRLVRGYLESAGLEVIEAVHGADALEQLSNGPFDLIVSDIEMPVMDGWTFARELRKRPNYARTPLLALTTLNSDLDREKAKACGFDRHEVKIEREKFLATVNLLLAGN